MKTWLVLLLIAFALIAGYKFSGYQHQLSESNAEKERLTNVLARSRATETSELKVIKPAAKLVSNETFALFHFSFFHHHLHYNLLYVYTSLLPIQTYLKIHYTYQ